MNSEEYRNMIHLILFVAETKKKTKTHQNVIFLKNVNYFSNNWYHNVSCARPNFVLFTSTSPPHCFPFSLSLSFSFVFISDRSESVARHTIKANETSTIKMYGKMTTQIVCPSFHFDSFSLGCST